MKGPTVLRIKTLSIILFFIELSLVSSAPNIRLLMKTADAISSVFESEKNDLPLNNKNDAIDHVVVVEYNEYDDVSLPSPSPTINNQCLSSQNMFQCPSGECIHKSYLCNGARDCKDGADEQDCPCMIYQFHCVTVKKCIHLNRVCDGNTDCDDGSDEMSCSNSTCSLDEFNCNSGGCVPEFLRCNGWNDCSDGSDENNCVKCEPSGFRCPNGTCVRNSYNCDDLEYGEFEYDLDHNIVLSLKGLGGGNYNWYE